MNEYEELEAFATMNNHHHHRNQHQQKKKNIIVIDDDDEEESEHHQQQKHHHHHHPCPLKKHRKILPSPPPTHPIENSLAIDDTDPLTIARSYQIEALEKAKRENTIVFLETGSGKTLIAIMLLRNYAYLLRKPSRFLAVFLVPTVVLVTQQAAAVEMHTDLKVGKYWGEMGVDLWDYFTWQAELEKYELLVMTPQILLDNLRHSFMKLDMIKLLIFDECHNARGKSPYACIMTEFYHPQLRSSSTLLPRIFGMTASPINSKGSSSSNNYGKKILELESLMNSKVYTVANESVLAEFIPFSTTKLKFYKHVDMPHALFSKLADHLKRAKLKNEGSLRELQLEDTTEKSALKKISKLFTTFTYCLTDLGVWLALKAAESLSCTETHHFFWGPSKDGIAENIIRNFSEDVFQAFSAYVPSDWQIGDSLREDMDSSLLTAKVNCLIESLMLYRTINDLRCIIFVERVITAMVLQSLLSQVSKISCWKTSYMAGSSSGLQFQSRKKQMDIIDDFRKGTVNIIVATQILEEGLDVQSCNLVIRFDPSNTVCSFIQSRGRARKQGSDYLLLLRSGDASTLSKVNNHLASGDIMREEALRNASLPCEPCQHEMYDDDFYRVETTGAVVTLNSSVALIYFYCSHLPSDGYFRAAPRFIFDEDFCTLHLPKSCPIQTICVQGEKNMLKKIVCLEACKKLHNIGALTDMLLPESVVEEADALEIGDKPYEGEIANYFPEELVSHCSSSSEDELYQCYFIGLKQNFEYNVHLRDIILLMKRDCKPDLEDLDFHLDVSRGSVTVNMVYTGTISLSANQVLMARRFQLTLLRVLMDHDLSKLKNCIEALYKKDTHPMVHYLLLPSAHSDQKSSIIDWDCVKSSLFPSALVQSSQNVGDDNKHFCSPNGCVHRIPTKDAAVCRSILENSLIFTPHNGRIYCITSILEDKDGNSVMEKAADSLTYKKYYKTRYGINLRYPRESLLSARQIFTVQNCLMRHKDYKEKESRNAWVELPPELCVIIMSPVTISTLYSFSLVPSIMHRFESILLALSLKKIQWDHCMSKFNIPTMKVLEAITTKKCQEEISLESLETLGDSFLKYAVSQHLFRTNNNHHEGLLTIKKGRMISNNFLCMLGCQREIQGFIRTECFNPKQWVVPGDPSCLTTLDETMLFASRKIYITGKRCMKSKVVADVVEALIGAYLSTCGELAALYFLDWLGMKVAFGSEVPKENPWLMHPERHVNVCHLESLLKYSFRDPSLLVEALTHGSYHLSEIPRCYQRLEFLGDSVLDYLITVYMYNKYPGMSPGLLTDLRSASVNNDCYARAAVQAGLHKHILHASSKLHKQIEMFVADFEPLTLESTFGWGSGTDLPKVLGDIIESLAGAILVDSNYNKDAVWESIKHLLEPLVTPETVKLHPVRELGEVCVRKCFEYESNVSHKNGMAYYTVEVKAEGKSYSHTSTGANKKMAKKLACKAVLDSLRASIPGL